MSWIGDTMSKYEREHAAVAAALGPDVGLSADWIESAFFVAPGVEGEYMRGDVYLLRDEDGGWTLVRRWNVDDAGGYPGLPAKYAADVDGYNDYTVAVRRFRTAGAALRHVRETFAK